MSNPAVGNVYQAIIDEVVNSSRVDFEESGVEESVLEELRQGWQQKLTQLHVAQFPWDPKPDPPRTSTTLSNPTGLSLPGMAQPQVQNGIKPEGNNIKTEPHVPIKQEPGLQAANRAAQQLQAQYGQRAASSINALHQQQGHSQQSQQQQPALPQPHQQQQPGLTQQQHQQQIYRQQMAAATAQQQQQHPANGQPHIQNGQTDGAGDLEEFEGVLMQRAADGNLHELGRVEIDRMLHEQILAKAKSMEGGGLMLPLKEATRISKCTLKDGVLTVNGKEYVFHKATGEYEW
ncbi:Transcription factor IIA, alpha/beta subunit [Fusarium oxysporum f. sp. vasinfectum]|nr:Transcription factor IIA, alpha/beta subunit [Fusarium oxysporum f. sp. vasinfectum]